MEVKHIKGSSIYDVYKKEQFFDPPPPLSTTVQFEGTPLPETDYGHPNFYHPPPHLKLSMYSPNNPSALLTFLIFVLSGLLLLN